MPISIYPPTLKSTQSPFIASEDLNLYFTLQSITAFNDIGHIQIRIVYLSNNSSILKYSNGRYPDEYPDGTFYKAPSAIHRSGQQYYVTISPGELVNAWIPGYLYKVLMRFGTTPKFTSPSSFATWKKEQIEKETFSEWSTVMVIKAITSPTVTILNGKLVSPTVEVIKRTEATLTPTFVGSYSISAASKEPVDSYRFALYRKDEDKYIERTDWLLHDASKDIMTIDMSYIQSSDKYIFDTMLTKDESYKVTYLVRTANGYMSEISEYEFTAISSFMGDLEGVELRIEEDAENGRIKVFATSDRDLSGNYVISRSSERTNYQIREDLIHLAYMQHRLSDELIYQDYTVESGVRYRYYIQYENRNRLRTNPLSDDKTHYVDFEYSYLYHDGVLLKLQFNLKMSSFKYTTLRTKQDTLGDRYPHLVLNGKAYYAEFPVTGLISFKMDGDLTFFTRGANGFYYNGELVIPDSKFVQGKERVACKDLSHLYYIDKDTQDGQIKEFLAYEEYDEDYHEIRLVIDNWIWDKDLVWYDDQNVRHKGKLKKKKVSILDCEARDRIEDTNDALEVGTNLIGDNIFIERIFRQKAEEFLNNFDYKLYKSPTEGNMVVALMNVSMTPNATLGRMIFEFSATAYEVLENTIENLNDCGIIHIGEFTTLESTDISVSFGLIARLYEPTDIYELIKKQEEISVGASYRALVKRVTHIWVEPYGKLDLTAEIEEYKALLSLAKLDENEDKIKEYEDRLAEEQDFLTLLNDCPQYSTTVIAVNGAKVLIAPNKVYSLTHDITSLTLVAAGYPLIVNYICELNYIEDATKLLTSAIDASKIWGLLAGVFTTTPQILSTYNFNYNNSPTFNIYGANGNYNVYKSRNIVDIIKEETLKEVEKLYNTKFTLIATDENGKVTGLTDGSVYYNFDRILAFDIEADEGTILKIGSKSDGSDAATVRIGPTCRYVLNSLDGWVTYIALSDESPQFCVINYKCLTNQETRS